MASFTPVSCGELENETGSVVSDSSQDSEHSDEETLLSRSRHVRSVYFQIPDREQIITPSCARCFSELIFGQTR